MGFPPKHQLIQLLGNADIFLQQYYGGGIVSKVRAPIFRNRTKAVMESLKRLQLKPRIVLDGGCGPMFISYSLADFTSDYIGVDIMPTDKLKKYRDAMRRVGVETAEVIRASIERLPFRDGVFDLVLALEVLEHLDRPIEAMAEIRMAIRSDSLVIVSLPLENLFQRLSRIGFALIEIVRNPILRRANRIPITLTRTSEYHYAGNIRSYDEMLKVLRGTFRPLGTKYTPIGLHRSININAVHVLQKK